jgi:hypothetical protein
MKESRSSRYARGTRRSPRLLNAQFGVISDLQMPLPVADKAEWCICDQMRLRVCGGDMGVCNRGNAARVYVPYFDVDSIHVHSLGPAMATQPLLPEVSAYEGRG